MEDLKNVYFFKHCQKILIKMKDKELKSVKNILCNETRIKSLYPYCIEVKLPDILPGKNQQVAETFKVKGNEFFKKGKNNSAIALYNQGILNCPKTTESSKQLLSILIANRSAAFFDLKCYKKAIFSIEYLLDIGSYPKDLLHKVWLRKAKCHAIIATKENNEQAKICYENVLEHLEFSKLKKEEKEKKIREVQASLRSLKTVKVLEEKNNSKNSLECLNENLITIKETSELGRFATASCDIEIGTTILIDTPYSSCVAPNNLTTNCQVCFISTDCFVSCEYCNSAIFCSRYCKEKANLFHQHECLILSTLSNSGVSLNCFLALRMITQKSLDFFLTKPKKEFSLKNKFDSCDYNVIENLCNHNDKRQQGQYVHYSCMVIFILRFLKQTNFFMDNSCKDDVLTDNELKIAFNLLNYLLLLEYNAHEISELAPSENSINGITKTIGAGIYPNLAFFNHSCEPSIIRYNIENKMIVKTVTPLKKGDVIYENYGPIYTAEAKEDRQKFLLTRYMFVCKCKPCVEDWPKLEKMKKQNFKIYCCNTNCRSALDVHKNTRDFEIKCTKCGSNNKYMGTLRRLMETEKIIMEGEKHFNDNFEISSEQFIKALKVYYKYVIPPHPDIVQLHQRLKECLAHLGNKSYEIFNKSSNKNY